MGLPMGRSTAAGCGIPFCRVWPSLGNGPSTPAHQHPLGTEAGTYSENWRWDLGLDVLILGLQVSPVVKNPPANEETKETWFRSPGWEDPLEEDMATHSSILAWRIPGTEEPGGLQSTGPHRVGHD